MNEGDPVEAYINAFSPRAMGPAEIQKHCTAVLRRPTVMARLEQIRKALHCGYAIDIEMITQNLIWSLHRAREGNNVAQVRNTAMDLAKLHGLVVDKSEMDNAHAFNMMRDVVIDGSPLDLEIGKAVDVPTKQIEHKAPAHVPHQYQDHTQAAQPVAQAPTKRSKDAFPEGFF